METIGTSFTCPNNTQLRVSYYTGGRDHSYIYFPLTPLPAASETSLDTAALRLYVSMVGGTSRRNVVVVPINRTFYEGTCTVPGYTYADAVATFLPFAGGVNSVNIRTYLDRVWQSGSSPNNGLALDWETTGDFAYIFDSREGSNPPYVDVEFTCP